MARLCAFLCVFTILVGLADGAAATTGSRVALVIGNSNYGPAIGKLKNPVNDANLIAETLKGLGFSVNLVLDADQRTMKKAVKAFGAKLREAGQDTTGFFYYAGHGVQVDGTNYLLPVGAEIDAEADVDIESVSADDVMTQIQSAGNAVNLVFFDACRNNPLARTNRSATRGLARVDAPRGSFVGYSTAPGDVAADGDGANSPYALALAEELKTPGISIEEAHRNVRSRVLAETGNKQTPWDSSSLTGPVILEPKAEASAPQPQADQQASVDKEALFWESIKDSKDPAEFEAYLRKYPAGTFAELATAKIANLKTPPLPAATASQSPTTPEPSASSQAATPGSTFSISADVKEQIDEYLGKAGTTGGWVLAVSKDGSTAAYAHCGTQTNSAGCPRISNPLLAAQNAAIRDCGGPGSCFVLYEGARKIIAAELVVQSAGAGQAPATSMPQPAQYLVHVRETRSDRAPHATEVISNIDGNISGVDKGHDKLSFIVIGSFDYSIGNFVELEILLQKNLGKKPPEALLNCPGHRMETWPDGSTHVVIKFDTLQNRFVAAGADCIVGALPEAAAFEAEFLTTHFRDIAAGMKADGTLAAIKHDGVRTFMGKVASGEVVVGK
ncbi:MAG TPA: caspase domain-containing protein [Dongiaceae bacterium]|jgi:carboxyl-terminal processing protease